MAEREREIGRVLEGLLGSVERPVDLVRLYDPGYRLLICAAPGTGIEIDWARRVRLAAQHLGWTASLDQPSSSSSSWDMVLYLSDAVRREGLVDVASYLALSDGSAGWFAGNVEALRGFRALLSASPVAADHLPLPLPVIPWYPSCLFTGFSRLNRPRLFYCGDENRSGLEVVKLLKTLAQKDGLDLYGAEDVWKLYPEFRNAWRGASVVDFIAAIQKSGIALILHSKKQLLSGSPSSRLFLAASAGAVIICDNHPFARKHLAQSALFLSPSKPLAEQVISLVEWIHQNKERAHRLAEAAHNALRPLDLFHHLDNLANTHARLL